MTKKAAISLVFFLSMFGMTACGNRVAREISEGPEFVEKEFVDYTKGQPKALTSSDGWSNGGSFGVTWKANNNTFDENGCRMSITKEGEEFYGSELKTTTPDYDFFQYGYFGTWMKPSNEVGTASTFFTYTGETDDNPHDEIDIEFLGKDTTKVQFNWFYKGKGGHEHLYSLGFDASEDYHQYGFLWTKEKITWYVDLKPVYETNFDIPTTPQRIFQNFWKGNSSDLGVMNWMGRLDESHLPCYCYAKCVTYADLSGEGLKDIPQPEAPVSIEDIPLIDSALHWAGDSVYQIEELSEAKGTRITYEGVTQNYANLSASLPEASKTANTFAMNIANNGSESVTVRLDLNMDAPLVEGGLSAANVKAYYGDGTEVRTDIEWGGSYFDIPAGENRDCVVEYYGPATKVMAMVDSVREGSHSGNVLFSLYRLGGINEYVDPNNGGQQDDTPITGDPLNVDFPSSGGYQVTKGEGQFAIAYSDLVGNSYSNIVSSLDALDLTGKEGIAFKVKNEGNEAVTLRVDLNLFKDEQRSCLNTSAKANGDLTGARTDLEWGGSYCSVPSTGEGVFAVNFEGEPNELMIFFDSCTYDDSTLHSGSLVLSDFVVF